MSRNIPSEVHLKPLASRLPNRLAGIRCVIGLCLALVASGLQGMAFALSVPITIKESLGITSTNWPTTLVLPLPYGQYTNTDSFAIRTATGVVAIGLHQASKSSAVMRLPFCVMLKRYGVLSNSVLGL